MKWKDYYKRTFKSVDGVTYSIVIQKKVNEDEQVECKEMQLAYDCPVLIEWNEEDKLEPVQSSSMTLKVLSETDREYIGLYTVEPGTIRVQISRDGKLYWSGMLDPELYEEPYAYKDHYEVQFTFSDFAILARKKWNMNGLQSISYIVSHIVGQTELGIFNNQFSEMSTHISGKLGFAGQYIICENFYDEDGEPMTMREVLDEILRSYALRLVQKNGNAHIYDLNYLYTEANTLTEEVYWKSANQTLGVDKVYSNVNVTFSPYAESTIVDGTIEHDDVEGKASIETIYMDTYESYDNYERLEGFHLYKTTINGNYPVSLNSDKVSYYRIDSVNSGEDEAGVLFMSTANPNKDDSGYTHPNLDASQALGKNGEMKNKEPLMTVSQGYIGSSAELTNEKKNNKRLKITLDVLVDVRYNPFEDAGDYNYKDNFQSMKDWCNFGYIPVMLYLKDSSGNILAHYENNAVRESKSYKHNDCKWVDGSGEWGCMWLCYYDSDNRKSSTGFGGWQTNKPIIGAYADKLPQAWKEQGDGELIEIPNKGGYLELQIGTGIYQCDYNAGEPVEKNIYSKLRWLLYKNPTISLVDKYGKEEDTKDIVDKAWLEGAAEEQLDIDTIVGTPTSKYSPPLTAKGCVLDENLNVITQFARGNNSGRLEHLLINTVYSQYGSRHETLSGTARIIPELKLLTDASSPNKRYVILGETQDLLQDTSEILMSELSEEIKAN